MKDLNYYKNNCEEDYLKTPISVLRYISELECQFTANAMSESVTTSMANISQQLRERIADFLDSESIQLEQTTSEINDPQSREESDLHIRMTKAAMQVYIETVQYPKY